MYASAILAAHTGGKEAERAMLGDLFTVAQTEGAVTAKELTAVLTVLVNLRRLEAPVVSIKQSVADCLSAHGADADGQLSEKEFLLAFTRDFCLDAAPGS